MTLIFKDYITVSQFATLCRCTRRTVYRWMKAGLVDWYETAPNGVHYFEKGRCIEYANAWKKRHAKSIGPAETARQRTGTVPEE